MLAPVHGKGLDRAKESTASVSAHLNHTGGRTGGVVIAWLVAMSSAEWLGCAGVRRGGTACDRRGHGVR